MKYKIIFILLIFLIPITSFSFDSKQLVRFKVIRICKNCDLSASNLSQEDLNDSIILNLKDPGSPVLVTDLSDENSFHVVMPMKI